MRSGPLAPGIASRIGEGERVTKLVAETQQFNWTLK